MPKPSKSGLIERNDNLERGIHAANEEIESLKAELFQCRRIIINMIEDDYDHEEFTLFRNKL